jgi:anti-anti-sigma factor
MVTESRFSCITNSIYGTVVVTLSGDVDMITKPEFTSILNTLLDHGAKDMVLDLRGVTYIDSSGLGVVLSTNKRVMWEGGRIAILDSNPPHHILEVARINTVIPVFNDLESATDFVKG